ncbi:D-alanyl-D-alanine carboxypeptidase [Gellertiella hungarica]|nr:D-alanyl-D-alanine carboxypeptidase [Gellertiella hungarica]
MFVFRTVTCLLFAAALFLTGSGNPAYAKGSKYAGIVVDAKTGNVLYSENPDSLRYPASLTKMMTLYLVFEALENGRIRLDTRVPVSKNAAAEPPSKLGLRPGNTITIEQGILGLVTRSANDASTAIGEFLGGSEARFAQMMTAKARALGMTRTTYRNANGLPNTAQMTTARDQARLGIALRKHFPQYYHYFSTRSFKFGKQVIGNHNRLLGVVKSVDGIKTGYTQAAGFNLVTSAQVDGRSIVGVVLGAPSGGWRNAQMTKLVKAYLPKASRGRGGEEVVAKAAPADIEPDVSAQAAYAPAEDSSTNAAAAALAPAGQGVQLPQTGPLPDSRYEAQPDLANATLSPDGTAGVRAKPASDDQSGIQPLAAPIPAADVGSDQGIDTLTTASTPKGWVVQVGVSPNPKLAMGLLDAAKAKGGKVLRSATPITVAVASGSSKLYRARFAGFDDQAAAVNACKVLKRRGVNCWASAQ